MTQVSKGYAFVRDGQQAEQLWEGRGALIRLLGEERKRQSAQDG